MCSGRCSFGLSTFRLRLVEPADVGRTTACVFILPSSEKISCSYSHLLLWLASPLSLKMKDTDIDFISVDDVAVHICAALSM